MKQPLQIETLLAAARRQTGLDDFGDETFREPLSRLLDSCENEAHLNTIGRCALAPEFRKIHPVSAHLPQECIAIMSHTFMSDQFPAMYDIPAYLAWLQQQDMRPVYQYHKQFLQHLLGDPIGVARRLYSQLGNDLSSEVELRMRAFLEAYPHAKHGQHSYTLAAFGMDPEKISKRFSSYCTRYSRHSSDSNREPSGPRDPVSTADPR